jgi:pimeloyl-ACP methyl ester carboxylesterase
MVVTALFATLFWNTILPETQDSLMLAPLPVEIRTAVCARLAAAVSALILFGLAANFFTGFSFPFLIVPEGGRLLRSVAAYWATMAGAGAFAFCTLLAIQSVTAILLPYPLFRRCSAYLQLCAVAAILGGYFLTPALAAPNGLTTPENRVFLACIPSFWFLGLFQDLNGPVQPLFHPLAQRAWWSLAFAFFVAAASYALASTRMFRRSVEQPSIGPINQARFIKDVLGRLVSRVCPRSLDGAVFLFTLRSLARSSQHRLLLAIYGGIGLALAVAYAKSFLEGYRQAPWHQPNVPLLIASVIPLTVIVIGVRALFALPVSLPANWIFGITAVHRPAAYFSATRRSLLLIAAIPIWIAAGVFFLAIWPPAPAIEHLLVLVVLGCMLIDLALYGFRSIPFTCSYLPGGANLKVRLGILALLILTGASVVTGLEYWAMEKTARYLVLLAMLLTAAAWAGSRRRAFAVSAYNRLQFERSPATEIFALDLHPEAALSGDEAWVNAIDDSLGRPVWKRIRPIIALAAVLLTAGFVYEQIGEWSDRRKFPQAGRSVDIGGRSLNLYCSGRGTPTVILESNWGLPGFSWAFIQRQIANFTQACWYDRAGYGWSDPGPFPNHSDTIARDLHELLAVSGTSKPYVLVGHSMGAFHVRVFRGRYPDEVAGLVLVDPMNEDMTIQIHNHIEALRPTVLLVHQVLGTLGFFRLLARAPTPVPSGSELTAREWATVMMLESQTKSVVATGKEPPLWISGELARASGGFGSIPVVVLSAGIQDQEEDPKLDHDHDWKLRLHAKLAGLSTRGTQITVENSGHQIPSTSPAAVIAAVRKVVTEARGADR